MSNLCRGTIDPTTGSLSTWTQSKTGMTNLIMARMPLLFSGQCPLYIDENRIGDEVTYTVYIEDKYGNPSLGMKPF